MRRLVLQAVLGACCLALIAPPPVLAQTSAPPPPPTVLRPDGRDFDVASDITFRVRAQPDEPVGSLRIELYFDDPEYDHVEDDGRYDREGPYWAGYYDLTAVDPGGDVYEVTVAREVFEGGEAYWAWHAYRRLPEDQCTPHDGEDGLDCFQESDSAFFHVADPPEHGAREPENNTPEGARRIRDLTIDGWLETRSDRDWYWFANGDRTTFRLLFGNYTQRRPAGENADVALKLYRVGRKRPVYQRTFSRGEDANIAVDVRRNTEYRLVVRHPKTAMVRARDLSYSLYANNGNGFR